MTIGPTFGCASGTSQVSRGLTAEPIMLQDGFAQLMFWRKQGDQRSETQEVLTAWGIEAASTNPLGTTLESVTLTESEEVIPHDAWTSVTAETATQAKPLVAVDALLIVRKEVRVSIQGVISNGQTGVTTLTNKLGLALGSTWTINPAVGSGAVSIEIDSASQVQSLQRSKSQTAWEQFSSELVRYVAGDGNTRLVTLGTIANTSTFPVPANGTFYRVSKTTSLSASDFARVTWAVEFMRKTTD